MKSWSFLLGEGLVQAHNRYGQVPAEEIMKLNSLKRLKGEALERCTVTESVPKNECNTSAARTIQRRRSKHMTLRRHFTATLASAPCACGYVPVISKPSMPLLIDNQFTNLTGFLAT